MDYSVGISGQANVQRTGDYWASPAVRIVSVGLLAVAEILVTSWLFAFEANVPRWQHPAYVVRQAVFLAIVSGVVLAMIGWPKRLGVAQDWLALARDRRLLAPIVVNAFAFGVLTVATVAFTAYAVAATSPPWGMFWLYCMALAATALSLVWLAAPFGFWRTVLAKLGVEIALSIFAGALVLLAGGLAQSGWDHMAGATLVLSYALIALLSASAHVDFDTRLLGIGDFAVYIDQSCSGYEGIGLVTAFLALFLVVFRNGLRFPNALLLLPVGIGAIWLLNSVRIAALIGLGAFVSPQVALSGFHSQAGWMAFLAVAVAMMTMAPRLRFFSQEGAPGVARPAHEIRSGDAAMLAYLAPFMALMAAGIVVSASAPYDTGLYGLKVAAVGIVLWLQRDVLATLAGRVCPLAVAAGLGVGIVWIATDPGRGQDVPLAAWIAAQPAWIAAFWLAIRSVGAIVIVPIAEELAFRGLLYRWIISRDFETVSFARFSWLALIVSSVLFGAMHSRWIEGTLAGAVFALLMWRSGRLSDPIAAHVAANAVIVGWAIGAAQWSLL